MVSGLRISDPKVSSGFRLDGWSTATWGVDASARLHSALSQGYLLLRTLQDSVRLGFRV